MIIDARLCVRSYSSNRARLTKAGFPNLLDKQREWRSAAVSIMNAEKVPIPVETLSVDSYNNVGCALHV